MIKNFKNFINESKQTLEIPTIPNTMNFWHGGNLDEYNDIISQRSGRYEYGAGLYLTSNYDIARKYAKGSRKLYIITVEKGNDISNAYIPTENIYEFVDKYVINSKKKDIKSRLDKHIKDDRIPADIFNNIILNEKAIKSTNTKDLRQFLIKNNIDYEMVDNAYGYGEKMLVLYNMKKIVNTIRVKPTDEIEIFDFFKNNRKLYENLNTDLKEYGLTLVNSAIDFMKEKYNLDVKITLKKIEHKKFFGDISLNKNAIENNSFVLNFNPNTGYRYMLSALFHELTHIKQVYTGELKPSEDYRYIIWKNDFKLPVKEYNQIVKNYNEYKKLPWEEVAYQEMDKLLDEFLESKYAEELKNSDDKNLRFIMNNI